MEKIKSFFLKFSVVAGVVVIAYFSWSVFKEIKQKEAVQEEIRKLQEEAEKITKENNDISQKISYLESQDYKEREIKEKLNLKSPDENVVVISPTPSQETEEAKEEDKTNAVSIDYNKKTNPEKWWQYFFSYSYDKE